MLAKILTLLVLTFGCINAAPAENLASTKSTVSQKLDQSNDDLKTASSAYQGYNDWSGGYPNGYSNYQGSGSGVAGYGVIDDRYDYGAGGAGGGYNRNYAYTSYPANIGYSGYGGYKSYDGYKGYGGYNGGGYGLAGNGGYGGYGGNGGLNSYYGYSDPNYQGAYHLGYGYTAKRHGNIYSSGITPSLVTGYRGYSRR